MVRPNKKTVNEETEDEQPLGEDRGLTKEVYQGANSSRTGEAEEQRLKELEEQVLRRQKELEEYRARAREKTLKQRIEEAKVTLRNLNEQLQNANLEVMNQEESHPAIRISQERNIQKTFISIDTSSPLSTNLQLAQ
jgi:t-SNARE complex subunit (syntaxin)